MKINPEATINFRNRIKKQSKNGKYSVELQCAKNKIKLRIFPEVFPPQSEYLIGEYLKSYSKIQELEVADIGTGSGIEAICAALLGVKHIDAIDINLISVQCAKENAILNKVDDKITFYHSDLFSCIRKDKKYNLIIANLPFVDFDSCNGLIDLALYDNNYSIHKKFFQQACKHLTKNGKILLPHANLQSGRTSNPNLDFIKLEKLINDYGFTKKIISQKKFRKNYLWRLYELKLK